MANNTGFSFLSLLDDIDKVSDLTSMLSDIANAVDKKIALRLGISKMRVNYYALSDALHRYSKDVHGLSRIKEELLNNKIDEEIVDKVILNVKNDAGLMLETDKPHIGKKIAYLSYHLSCLKPFSVEEVDKSFFENDLEDIENMGRLFNELVICSIISLILYSADVHPSGRKLDLIFNNNGLKYLIHSLKYRNLNRASLELLFETLIRVN